MRKKSYIEMTSQERMQEMLDKIEQSKQIAEQEVEREIKRMIKRKHGDLSSTEDRLALGRYQDYLDEGLITQPVFDKLKDDLYDNVD